jgi:hypothetical protein
MRDLHLLRPGDDAMPQSPERQIQVFAVGVWECRVKASKLAENAGAESYVGGDVRAWGSDDAVFVQQIKRGTQRGTLNADGRRVRGQTVDRRLYPPSAGDRVVIREYDHISSGVVDPEIPRLPRSPRSALYDAESSPPARRSLYWLLTAVVHDHDLEVLRGLLRQCVDAAAERGLPIT